MKLNYYKKKIEKINRNIRRLKGNRFSVSFVSGSAVGVREGTDRRTLLACETGRRLFRIYAAALFILKGLSTMVLKNG